MIAETISGNNLGIESSKSHGSMALSRRTILLSMSSVNVTSTVKGNPSIVQLFETCTMQSSRSLASFDFLKSGRFMIRLLRPEEGWNFFWTLPMDMLFLCVLLGPYGKRSISNN